MMKRVYYYLVALLFYFLLFTNISCENQTIISQDQVRSSLNDNVRPVNIEDYRRQIELIRQTKPQLYNTNISVYQAIDKWLHCLEEKCTTQQMTLSDLPLTQVDSRVHLTSYYTPVITVRNKPDSVFRYPLYLMPDRWIGPLPSRSEIYAGVLRGKQLEIAYSASLIDNFIMQVQGSGYVDFSNGKPLCYFSFSGNNNYPYKSIGRLLVKRGEISYNKLSLRAIKEWLENQNEDVVIDLLKQNQSFVFFLPKPFMPVTGFTGVPLVAKTAVAVDPSIISLGSVLLVEMPRLEKEGNKLISRKEWRLMVALDVGSAIKGKRLDIYQGVGETAGEIAGYYNHVGNMWRLVFNKKNNLIFL